MAGQVRHLKVKDGRFHTRIAVAAAFRLTETASSKAWVSACARSLCGVRSAQKQLS